jgi:hypothetical protein
VRVAFHPRRIFVSRERGSATDYGQAFCEAEGNDC